MKTTLFILFILLAGCSKDNSGGPILSLPPETQVGANTFGCLINNKLVIPRDGEGSIMGPDRAFYLWGDPSGNDQYTEIDVRDYKSYRTAKILIHIQHLSQLGVGNYVIDESNGSSNIDGLNHNYIHCRVFNQNLNYYRYYGSTTASGMLTITRYEFIPGQKLIISGTFSATVKSFADPNDIIQIKMGRFDIDGTTLRFASFP